MQTSRSKTKNTVKDKSFTQTSTSAGSPPIDATQTREPTSPPSRAPLALVIFDRIYNPQPGCHRAFVRSVLENQGSYLILFQTIPGEPDGPVHIASKSFHPEGLETESDLSEWLGKAHESKLRRPDGTYAFECLKGCYADIMIGQRSVPAYVHQYAPVSTIARMGTFIPVSNPSAAKEGV